MCVCKRVVCSCQLQYRYFFLIVKKILGKFLNLYFFFGLFNQFPWSLIILLKKLLQKSHWNPNNKKKLQILIIIGWLNLNNFVPTKMQKKSFSAMCVCEKNHIISVKGNLILNFHNSLVNFVFSFYCFLHAYNWIILDSAFDFLFSIYCFVFHSGSVCLFHSINFILFWSFHHGTYG